MKKLTLTAIVALVLSLSCSFVACGSNGNTSESKSESESGSVVITPGSESESDNQSEVIQEPEMSADLQALLAEKNAIDLDVDTAAQYGETEISLGNFPSANGENASSVTISNNAVTISAYGTYVLEGNFSGTVYVTPAKEDGQSVNLILNGVEIYGVEGPAICATGDTLLVITAQQDSDNYLSDSESYNDDNSKNTAGIFAKGDLTINGTGKITVNGLNKHGINSKDTLYIENAEIVVENAVKSGIKGDDATIIKNAKITVTSAGDGIKADTEDADDEENPTYYQGYIYCENSNLTINGGDDAIQAFSYVVLKDTELNIIDAKTGNGINANRLISVENSEVKVSSYAEDKDAFNCKADEDEEGNPMHYSGIVIDGTSTIMGVADLDELDTLELVIYPTADIE